MRFTFLIVIYIAYANGFVRAQNTNVDWVSKYPINNEYFIGIAYADKKNNNYIEAAKAKAIQNLANEITIKIIGQTSMKTIEVENQIKQSYFNAVTTETINELEGYELVDTWQDKNSYWVYYRLNKNAYYQIKKDKLKTAIELANIHLQFAESNLKEFKYNIVLINCFKAASLVQNYLYFEYDNELKNRANNIFIQSNKIVNNCLNNIVIKPEAQSIKLKAKELSNYNLKFSVYNKENLKPISNLPFALGTISGNVNIETKSIITNHAGNASFIIKHFGASSNKYRLKVSLNNNELFSELIKENNLLAIELYKKIVVESIVDIEIEQLNVFIQSNEKNLNQPSNQKLLLNAIQSNLIKNGINSAKSANSSDYIILIESNSTKGNSVYEMQVVYLDISFILKQQDRIILSKTLNGIKGIKATEEAATNDAYQKAIRKFDTELYPELLMKIGISTDGN